MNKPIKKPQAEDPPRSITCRKSTKEFLQLFWDEYHDEGAKFSWDDCLLEMIYTLKSYLNNQPEEETEQI